MKNRFEFAVNLQHYESNNKLILDIGCRDKTLKQYLKNNIKYQGIDFEDNDEVIGYNLENGIPFEDDSFDVVFALDILEHLENIHFLIHEVVRVARNEVIIALPNCYHWHYKKNIILNKPLNTKYKIPLTKVLDRHRWVTFHSANKFLIFNVLKDYDIEYHKFICNYKNHKSFFYIDRFFSKYFPNTFVYTDFFHIKIKK